MPFVNEQFVVPEVPFARGTQVRVKRGPNSKYTWTVYDHHGVTWPEGEDVSRVVLVRGWTEEEIKADRDPHWAAVQTKMLVTTWGRIKADD